MSLIPLTTPYQYILEGRLVTMGPQGVVPDGAIFIEDGVIRAVQTAGAPPPAGFENAQHVRTGDTLYPGLIELHNHLAYNAIPLWLLPDNAHYTNNGQWRSKHVYRRNVSIPAQVLGKSAGLVEAVIRFTECRSLLGGTTTSQGITLIGVGTKDFFPGLVRNVEAPQLAGLKPAKTRIDNPPNKEEDKPNYLEAQKDTDCYLQHLSEGIDDTARGWFLRLKKDDNSWYIHDSLCGIHSTALKREDFDVLQGHGASMVWSPLSNYLLYGETVDLQAVADSNITVGLGSDWGPSGSKSLLGELKVAWLANQDAGSPFTAEKLVQMATINAARIVHWDALLGSIEPGKRADIIAINGKSGDPFMQLIEARETGITLVVIDGIPRVGQPGLMESFDLTDPEPLTVGDSERILHLAQDNAHELVQGLTLAEATSRLSNALESLPALADTIDNALLSGAVPGAPGSPLSAFQIDLELEDEPLETFEGSLAEAVSAMKLEPITVADDPDFLAKLVASNNLPDFISNGLPALYGKPVPQPFQASEQQYAIENLPPRVNASVQTLRDFMDSWHRLTLSERKRIVEQALVVLDNNYVHLPFKRAMYGIDPVQQLRLVRHRLNQTKPDALEPDTEFHSQITRIFHTLRDLHTTYRLPDPFRGMVALLPFFVEEYWDEDEDRYRYLISKLIKFEGETTDETLKGAELLYWNGVPIAQAIAANAERQAGNNPDARRVRSLNSLTIRPLGRGLPPDEDWVTIGYRDAQGDLHESRQEWLVFMPNLADRGSAFEGIESISNVAVGLDDHTNDIQDAKKVLFSSKEVKRDASFAPSAQTKRIRNAVDALETCMPTVMRARIVPIDGRNYGHLRIFTFNVANEKEFVEEIGRLLQEMQDSTELAGVLVDIRGNGGGLIPAAEGALRLFTAQRIEPQRAQFINTPLNLRLCEINIEGRYEEALLGRWIESIRNAVQTGAIYSLGFPISDPDFINSIEPVYHGPVALIIDALCYSAADMFAAGFQDHNLGPVIGTHMSTGAGGANVWSHGLLQQLAATIDDETLPQYEPLPEGADFHVAMRRTIRVGENAGDVVEDLGIKSNRHHLMTKNDLLENNKDLLGEAAAALAEWQAERPHVQVLNGDSVLGQVAITIPATSTAEATINVHVHPDLVIGTENRIDLDQLLADIDQLSVDLVIKGKTESGETYNSHARLK